MKPWSYIRVEPEQSHCQPLEAKVRHRESHALASYRIRVVEKVPYNVEVVVIRKLTLLSVSN